ncbi:MAG: SLC13 family permease [Planctomycetota bacterium]
MGFALIVTLVVLVLAMILFFGELLPAGQTALLAAAALLATGVLEVEEVLAGFSNEATITVLCMFVVSAGIERTGGVNLVSDSLTRLLERGERTALLTLSVGAGALSAFVNNTTVVAILLPALLRCSQKAGVSPSKLLIPLSFASMLGGCCTLVGTRPTSWSAPWPSAKGWRRRSPCSSWRWPGPRCSCSGWGACSWSRPGSSRTGARARARAARGRRRI